MKFVPLTLKLANNFVEAHHRHSSRTNNDGGKFAIGIEVDGELVGVAICGRPVARMLQDQGTAEVVRCCVSDKAPKGAPSALYQRCARIWQLMGGTRIVTYTLKREGGESMRNLAGGGWSPAADVKGNRQWDTKSRRRKLQDIYEEPKTRHDRLL
jgi:hypothetical protein